MPGWLENVKRLTPLWKIKRELIRPLRQLSTLHHRLSTYCFGAAYYDLALRKRRQVSKGALPMTTDAVIFVIYPTTATIPASYLMTLSYLASHGCGTVVVSNKRLSDADRARLLPLCHQIIERENFGYDFGAYRDGVLSLAERLPTLNSLILLNDSVWFPLPGARDWLEDAAAMGRDLVAAASNYGNERKTARSVDDYRWTYSTDHRNFHYCSFALRVGPKILRDGRFLRFWRGFPLTNDKTRTVRRGEIGLSTWVLKHGFSHGETLDISTLDEQLARLSRDRLLAISHRLVIPESEHVRLLHERFLANPAGWSDKQLRGLILATVSGQGASYALAEFTTKERGFPFLKKSPLWLSRRASDTSLAIAADLPGDEGRTILAEARALRAARAPHFDSDPPSWAAPQASFTPAPSYTSDTATPS